MKFQPVKQFNTILQQQYLEPTISWSIRVVLALNVPLIVLPILFGFSYHIVWASFAAYMLTLIDYRGSHVRKILIQLVEAILILITAFIGLNIGNSIVLSIACMFVIGMFAALIRNYSDYGSSIGVGVGFFYLFGIANPVSIHDSWMYIAYIGMGSGWAILIIMISFLFSGSNPLRRSVATIWKKNTEYLDAVLENFLDDHIDSNDLRKITTEEVEIREAIDKSIELFNRRKPNAKIKASHYDKMIEIRQAAAFFGATIRVIHQQLQLLRNNPDLQHNQSILYKTLSALSQASARLSIVIFTLRGEDITITKVRITRYQTAVNILKKLIAESDFDPEQRIAATQLISSLDQCSEYMQQTIGHLHETMNLKRSNYFENYKLSFNNFAAGLQPKALWDVVKEVFNANSQQFKYSLRVALALALAVFIYKFFKIDHGHWIAFTLLIVIQPYYGATLKKGTERIIGTTIGILVGGLIMLLPISHNGFVIILVFISFFVAYYLRNNYKIGVFFVTIMLVVMMQLSLQATWELIGWRLLSTLIGAALAILASIAFWPVWEKQRFPVLISQVLKDNLLFLRQVIQSYNDKSIGDVSWHKGRRVAEAAGNNAFACVQRMYEEPQANTGEIDVHFAKVGSNIRISREITSLAFTLQRIPYSDDLAKILDEYLQDVENMFSTEEEQKQKFDPKKMKDILQHPFLVTDENGKIIRFDLEKILFELQAMGDFGKK